MVISKQYGIFWCYDNHYLSLSLIPTTTAAKEIPPLLISNKNSSLFKKIAQRSRHCVTFPHAPLTGKAEDHPLPAIRDCLFATPIGIWKPSGLG